LIVRLDREWRSLMDGGFLPSIRHDPRLLRQRAGRLGRLAREIAQSGNHLIASKLLRVASMLEGMALMIDGPTQSRLPN
jgi:hypothetical protein